MRSPLHRKTPSAQTNLWYVHYSRSHTDGQPVETELRYLRFFGEQATNLGLRLEILTHGEGLTDVETEFAKPEFTGLDYRVTTSETPVLKWAEDSAEHLDNGVVTLPMDCELDLLLIDAMSEGRRSRWQGLINDDLFKQVLGEDHLWIPLGIKVHEARMIPQQIAAAKIRNQATKRFRAYIEGGNMITGEDAQGRTIVLIGKDAVDSSTELQEISGDRLKDFLVQDFQLESPDQIIFVEQPGQFHLDMGMLFLGNGKVVVNDSEENYKNAREIAQLVPSDAAEKMANLLELQYKLEAIAAQDLEAVGLEVKRQNLANGVYYNFCNGEFVTGKDGKSYYITNGAAEIAEAQFRELMVKEWQAVNDVIFAPRELTHKSLQEKGGLGCRIKGACLP